MPLEHTRVMQRPRDHRLPETVAPSAVAADQRPLVFLFPGLSGDLAELASFLKPADTPIRFTPIHYRHWSELQRHSNDLGHLITDCIRQVESHKPSATLLFVGYSFGGLIAWNVAQDMAAAGYRIGFLGLVDAPASPDIEADASTTAGRFGRLVRGIRRGETAEQLARSSAGILFRSPTGRARDQFRRLHRSGVLPRIFGCIDLNLQVRYHVGLLQESVARMQASAHPRDYPSVLFRSAAWPAGEDGALGWRTYLTNLTTVALTGSHADILAQQNVDKIIFQIATILSESEDLSDSLGSHLYVNPPGCLLSDDQANCRKIL